MKLDSKDLIKLYNKFLIAFIEYKNIMRLNVVDAKLFEDTSYNFEQSISDEFTRLDEVLKEVSSD